MNNKKIINGKQSCNDVTVVEVTRVPVIGKGYARVTHPFGIEHNFNTSEYSYPVKNCANRQLALVFSKYTMGLKNYILRI